MCKSIVYNDKVLFSSDSHRPRIDNSPCIIQQFVGVVGFICDKEHSKMFRGFFCCFVFFLMLL